MQEEKRPCQGVYTCVHKKEVWAHRQERVCVLHLWVSWHEKWVRGVSVSVHTTEAVGMRVYVCMTHVSAGEDMQSLEGEGNMGAGHVWKNWCAWSVTTGKPREEVSGLCEGRGCCGLSPRPSARGGGWRGAQALAGVGGSAL